MPRTLADMTPAEHLRYMAKDHLIAGNEHTADALLAGAEALDTRAHTVDEQDETIQALSRLLAGAEEAATDRAAQIERVRAVLTDLRGQQEAALQRWDDTGDTWDGATSDTLHDTIHLLTEALEGDA